MTQIGAAKKAPEKASSPQAGTETIPLEKPQDPIVEIPKAPSPQTPSMPKKIDIVKVEGQPWMITFSDNIRQSDVNKVYQAIRIAYRRKRVRNQLRRRQEERSKELNNASRT